MYKHSIQLKKIINNNKIFISVFIFLSLLFLFRDILGGNEGGLLASAKQLIDKNWIKNDWTLNLNPGYRDLFDIFFGIIARFFPLYIVSIIGRIIIYMLFGYLVQEYARVFKIKIYLIIPFLFFFLQYQDIIAGEWIIGQLETKSFSYFFILLSLIPFIKKQYHKLFLFLGLGVSFHALIGTYSCFCILAAFFLNYNYFKADKDIIFKKSYIFFIASSFGIFAIIQNLYLNLGIDTRSLDNIIVGIRGAHHALPSLWKGKWILKLILTSSFLSIVLITVKKIKYRTTASFSLCSLTFFITGLLLFWFKQIHLLKYFWFRLPDVILPFFSFFIFFSLLNEAIEKYLQNEKNYPPLIITVTKSLRIFFILATCVLMFFGFYKFFQSKSEIKRSGKYFYLNCKMDGDLKEALIWIRHNTSKDSIFLASPSINKFHIGAERAQFVSFKFMPLFGRDILEWYKRIKLCNNNEELKNIGLKNKRIIDTNFYNLDENLIRKLVMDYNLDYYLGKTEKNYSFPKIYENQTYSVYSIK